MSRCPKLQTRIEREFGVTLETTSITAYKDRSENGELVVDLRELLHELQHDNKNVSVRVIVPDKLVKEVKQ